MTAGETFLYILRRTGLVLGALFLMTVFLAAMPGHRAPIVSTPGSEEISSTPSGDVAEMSGMKRDDAKINKKTAVQQMRVRSDAQREQLKMNPTR